MNLAFCVFDGMTPLDFVGAYDPITRLERMGFRSIEWDVCGRTDRVSAAGLTVDVDCVNPRLDDYDLVFVPGGPATRTLVDDEPFVDWLRSADPDGYLVSVCTGSLLLGAAGFLEGKRATTHPAAMELLSGYAEAVEDRVVIDGRVITGGGVAASIDLGLVVVEKLADRPTREAIAEQLDYPYGPWGTDAAVR